MFKTNPKHPLDWVLWPLLRLVWEKVLGSRKTSHFWHWRKTSLVPTEMLVLLGDPATIKVTGRLSNFLGTNFLWQKVAILEAVSDEPFRVGICTQSNRGGKGTQLLCSILLPKDQCFGVLIGAEDVGFYGETDEGVFVPLKVASWATRTSLPANIPLL